jgi:signal peptidase II
MMNTPNRRIISIAAFVLVLDQLTKKLVNTLLQPEEERVVIDGFFKFVHWSNTGAAWSLFTGKNSLLAIVALLAMYILFRSRHHFDAHTLTGQIALGMIFGGILGNLTDRLFAGHVTDFLRFHLQRRGGTDIGFPAFNIADSAICIGVALIFILSWKNEREPASAV